MPLNEADTRAQLIDPQLNVAGWTRSQVTREHYYRTDWAYTAGKIVLRGDRAERLPPKRVDYLLRYTDSLPIAVVEAKDESKPAVAGLQQARDYARDLGLAFAFATNGHEIIEWDAFTGSTRPCERFPAPEELWSRWQLNTGPREQTALATRELRPLYSVDAAQARRRNPLLHPYAPAEATRGKEVRYFQEVAVRATLQRIMRGQKRILLTMATGTGKTFTALQIVWKLIKSGWLARTKDGQPVRVLFLADRVVLRDQAYNTFSPFATTASDPRLLLDENARRPSLHREIYFAIYQTLWNEDGRGKRFFEKFPPDFFDLIIIDEAHRSGFGTWREILDYFSGAIHLGMTATPKQEENIDTYGYFCAEEPAVAIDAAHPEKGAYHPPAYVYSLGQGIEDGFLATYKVHRIRTDLDKNGLHIHEAIEKGAEIFVPQDAVLKDAYDTPEFERAVSLPDRTVAMTSHLARLLRRFGPMQKTMVFCVDINHAQEVARMLEPMSLEQYLDYTRGKIAGFVPDSAKLQAIWRDPEQRRVLLEQLEKASIDVDVLAEVLVHPEADQFDLLANLAYGRLLRSRAERASEFRRRERPWLDAQAEVARAVILALVDKYVLGGLREMTDPAVFRVSPFREMGEARGVLRRFGGDPQRFRATMIELQHRLYAEAA